MNSKMNPKTFLSICSVVSAFAPILSSASAWAFTPLKPGSAYEGLAAPVFSLRLIQSTNAEGRNAPIQRALSEGKALKLPINRHHIDGVEIEGLGLKPYDTDAYLGARCSAVWIGGPYVLTAGHCFEKDVMNWFGDDRGNPGDMTQVHNYYELQPKFLMPGFVGWATLERTVGASNVAEKVLPGEAPAIGTAEASEINRLASQGCAREAMFIADYQESKIEGSGDSRFYRLTRDNTFFCKRIAFLQDLTDWAHNFDELALVELTETPQGRKPAQLVVDPATVAAGDDIFTMGYPAGAPLEEPERLTRLTEVAASQPISELSSVPEVAAIMTKRFALSYVGLDASFGNSGGPLFKASTGELVGLVDGQLGGPVVSRALVDEILRHVGN
jgi:hypothetical protein